MDILRLLSGITDGTSNADIFKLAHDEITRLRQQLAKPVLDEDFKIKL